MAATVETPVTTAHPSEGGSATMPQPQTAQTADMPSVPDQPGTRGWWGRHQWRHYRAKIASQDAEKLGEMASDDQPTGDREGQNTTEKSKEGCRGRRHGGHHSWHREQRQKFWDEYGPLGEDGKPMKPPGYDFHGNGPFMPPWRRSHYGGFGCYGYGMHRPRIHDESYIFMEFDFINGS